MEKQFVTGLDSSLYH